MTFTDLYVPVYSLWELSLYEIDFLINLGHPSRRLKYVFCSSDLEFCPVKSKSQNPTFTCSSCMASQHRNIELIKKHSRYSDVSIIKSNYFTNSSINVSEFGKQISLCTKSTLTTHLRDVNAREDTQLARKIRNTAINNFQIALTLIPKCDRVIFFNGRMARYHPYLVISKLFKKSFMITEAPSVGVSNLIISKKNYLHDQSCFSLELLDSLNACDNQKIKATFRKHSRKWLDERTALNYSYSSSAFLNHQYVKKGFKGKIPINIKRSKQKVITFFVSSPFDQANIPEKVNAFSGSQIDAINTILKIPQTQIVIKLHPNLTNGGEDFINKVKKLSSKNCIIIHPDDICDTYELIKYTHLIISFGSTVNVEAAYLGKKSIVCGVARYMYFGFTVNVKDCKELHLQATTLLKNSTDFDLGKKLSIDYITALQLIGHRLQNVKNISGKTIFKKKFKFYMTETLGYFFKRNLSKFSKVKEY